MSIFMFKPTLRELMVANRLAADGIYPRDINEIDNQFFITMEDVGFPYVIVPDAETAIAKIKAGDLCRPAKKVAA